MVVHFGFSFFLRFDQIQNVTSSLCLSRQRHMNKKNIDGILYEADDACLCVCVHERKTDR